MIARREERRIRFSCRNGVQSCRMRRVGASAQSIENAFHWQASHMPIGHGLWSGQWVRHETVYSQHFFGTKSHTVRCALHPHTGTACPWS